MFELIKKLLGLTPTEKVDLVGLRKDGALILDVRTSREFGSGHIKGAVNIPVQVLAQKVGQIKKKDKMVIAYCKSGQRSALATRILKKSGIIAYNGGGYHSLSSILK